MQYAEMITPTIWLIILLFLILNMVLWFFLPFAIFGTKKKIDESNRINAAILEKLGQLYKLQMVGRVNDVDVRFDNFKLKIKE